LTAASIAALDTLRARGVFVSFVDPLANIPAPNMLQRLPVAGEQVGSLEETDFIIYDNSFADAYVLAPQAGSGVLLLDLASDFAGELLVLSEGIIVAANNEASEDGSVLLDVEIEAGNAYVVVVTSVNFQTGSYTLVSFLE
jgi:hypothetical protein